jgi:endonuclease/exonuclease/phosphatase family metal-dependent hydrolase
LLLPGGLATVTPELRYLYAEKTELLSLLDAFEGVPRDVHEFTHFPNDPLAKGPDRVIDYLFHNRSGLEVVSYRVLKEEGLELSDHFPVLVTLARKP